MVEKYSGPYSIILDFPEGSVHPNGVPARGFKLNQTTNYDNKLIEELKKLGIANKIEWAGLEIFEKLPNVDEHDKEKYPAMFK